MMITNKEINKTRLLYLRRIVVDLRGMKSLGSETGDVLRDRIPLDWSKLNCIS